MIDLFLVKLGLKDKLAIDKKCMFTVNVASTGRFKHGCENFYRIMGYTYGEWSDKSPYDYLHPEDIELVLESHMATFKKGGIPRLISRLKKKDGEYICVKTRSTIIGDEIHTFSLVLN